MELFAPAHTDGVGRVRLLPRARLVSQDFRRDFAELVFGQKFVLELELQVELEIPEPEIGTPQALLLGQSRPRPGFGPRPRPRP